jgi:hypothetical protein
MNLGNNNVNVDDEESTSMPASQEADYPRKNDTKTAMEDYPTARYQSSLVLKKPPTSLPLHLEEHGVGDAPVVPANATSLLDKNATILSAESPAPPKASSFPLHSPSMTSSPRSAELASSEVGK